MKKRIFGFWLIALLSSLATCAQRTVTIDDNTEQHIFREGELEYLEDFQGSYTFRDILRPEISARFRPNRTNTPQNDRLSSAYWYRISIDAGRPSSRDWLLEFFDQTIDELSAYAPDASGRYTEQVMGDSRPFRDRTFRHKNFEIKLPYKGKATYYFRVQSHQTADVIIVLRSVNRFVQYALDEYILFGIFYGMIFVFSFYNLLMFFAVRQVQYLYYVLYNLFVGLYEMCVDGIAYQYLWPRYAEWNQYAYGIALYGVSVFALLFTRSLLFTRRKAPGIDKIILGVLAARSVFFLYCLFWNRTLFNYKFLELIPLAIAFYAGLYVYRQGYRPARFFVLGYAFLTAGFIYKLLIMLHFEGLNFGAVTYYSLSICFVIEMICLSFAVGDKVRVLKRQKDLSQQQTIRQMAVNQKLKDALNTELEAQVEARTSQVKHQAEIIEEKNRELMAMNELLRDQASEISRMNELLQEDNRVLQTNVEQVTRARVLSSEVDFEEFSKIYPDNESCFEYLAGLKWQQGYHCRKCGNDHYFHGHLPFSRRCTKCGYDESAIAYTLLQNTKIPINKAFYMIFLIYTTKGKISSHKLSQILQIRQSTCWSFGNRIRKMMEEKKREPDRGGWSKIVYDPGRERGDIPADLEEMPG